MVQFLDTTSEDFEARFAALLGAKREEAADVDDTVAAIIAEVRARGDAALLDLTERFDRLRPEALRLGAAEIDALVAEVAQRLAQGQLVAWFQGRAEFGPRALGARSFLADPRRDAIREDLNAKIKKRELFRPFAPSVTAEAAAEIFEIDQTSPYMNIVARVRPDRAADIPAVTHVDGTARVHTVAAAEAPLYHALLAEFGRLTGVPVLLNTSFNIQEPIVYSPADAVATFAASGVDLLAIGSFLVTREALA